MALNWKHCVIYQQDTSESLKCPLHTAGTSRDKTDVYQAFLINVQTFRDIDAHPVELYFDSEASSDDFTNHSASWHKSCHLKFNNLKLSKAKRKVERSTAECEVKKRSNKRREINNQNCLFCERECDEGDLHEVSTFDTDSNIRAMITELQDTKLLARISGGDLMCIEAKYHVKCLVKHRNRYRNFIRKSNGDQENTNEQMSESRAFVELTRYVKESVDSGTFIFKLSEIHTLYVNHLQDLGISKEVNKTRLKIRVLNHFPDVQQQCDGRSICILFKEGIRNILKDVIKKRDFEEDALILSKAATIIRKDIFDHKCFRFTGDFPHHCQEDSLPSSLTALVSMIMNDNNLQHHDVGETQVCLTVCQTIVYNTKIRTTNPFVKARHGRDREPPLPIYIGLSIHAFSRSKKIIDQLFQMGISISYDRVLVLEDLIATSTCERFGEDGVVSPTCLRKGLFTVGALDNLDHDPSSTTSTTSFHGTGITLFQFPSKTNHGECRPPITIPPSGSRNHSLPDSYAIVPAVALTTTSVVVPAIGNVRNNPIFIGGAIAEETRWVEHALPLVQKEDVDSNDAIVWAAYHAALQPATEDPRALLPLFYEKSATPAMIKHGMDMQRQAVKFLNPGQIPVTTFDQPLFALAKFMQWKWPTTHGELKHVVILGGLHTEMSLWNSLGDLLENSGWMTALTEASVASSGVAQSLLNAAHLTRTRHAHQITLLTLHKLQREAFMMYEDPTHLESFASWRATMLLKSPTFMFWDLIMRYETLILIFIRAHRAKNFNLYVEVLEKLTPLFFALDHVNYARWMPVHIRDMKSLPDSIREEFEKHCSGFFQRPPTSSLQFQSIKHMSKKTKQ